jgi:hypothetical protein
MYALSTVILIIIDILLLDNTTKTNEQGVTEDFL